MIKNFYLDDNAISRLICSTNSIHRVSACGFRRQHHRVVPQAVPPGHRLPRHQRVDAVHLRAGGDQHGADAAGGADAGHPAVRRHVRPAGARLVTPQRRARPERPAAAAGGRVGARAQHLQGQHCECGTRNRNG